MLTIINDPAGVTGRQCYAWDHRASIQENIERRLRGGYGCTVLLNGVRIEPASDPAMARPPAVGDVLTVVRRPEGFDPFTLAMIAIAVATAVVSIALMPKPANMADMAGKDSPNNRLTAQSNTARAYQAIPDVYGWRRVWPDLIQPSTIEYVDHIKTVTEWLCVSRGRGNISAVQYADTPISDIAGASYEVFKPSIGSDGYPEGGTVVLRDVVETFESPEVNGQELVYPTAYSTITPSGSFSASSGATTFTITVSDNPSLDKLKSLAPGGTASVSFSYVPAAGGAAVTFNATCGVLSFSVSGGSATFTFSSAAWASAQGRSGILFTIIPNGQDSSVIGPFTMPIDCDRLRWSTVFLRGLKGTVQIRATWWRIDSGGLEISGTRQAQVHAYTADTFDARYWTTSVTPSAGSGRYRVQFERISLQIGSQGVDVAKLEEVYAMRHYAEKQLPGVTVIRLTTTATEQATGYSERKFNLRWQRHVRGLASSALTPSRNFARSMAHVWSLAGGEISELDTDALQAINDSLGEDSPLLRFDMALDDADMSLGERLQLIAMHARCRVWRDGTRWTVTRDERQSVPWLQLDYRTLAAGGDSAVSYSAHLPAAHDGVELEYVSEDTQAAKAYIRLSVASGAVVEARPGRPQKIQMPGCTNAVQAMNRAQLEARRMLYNRTSVQDTVLGDAAHVGLGRLVRWIDPADFDGSDDGVQAGEVLALAGSTIQTSEPLAWGGSTVGRMLLTGPDGRYIGPPVLCYPATGGAVLSSAPSGLYAADGIASQCGSRYAFTVGLSGAELESAGLYTLEEAQPGGDGTVSVTLRQYDDRAYAYDT